MGTRHKQTVINQEGEVKIAQYGQWDGYPSGQGKDILNYLKTGDLDKFKENLKSVKVATDKQLQEIDKVKDWSQEYPYLSRDCGSKIYRLIENGEVPFVCHISEDEALKWCEGFYTIDFQKRKFISEYHGIKKSYSLDKLPTKKAYLKAFEND